LKLEKIRQI
jgi:hypothetical protein